MRANALLKLFMGSAGGLVIAVSGVQCQPGVDNDPQNILDQYIDDIYQATGTDGEATLGVPPIYDIYWDSPRY
jgi:hypothetical protein